MKNEAVEMAVTAVKVYPYGVAGAALAGMSLQQWVLLSALAVGVCQLIAFGWKFWTWLKPRIRKTPQP